LIYECINASGCTGFDGKTADGSADNGPNSMTQDAYIISLSSSHVPSWFLLRYSGVIVSDFTTTSAFEYEDYMYIISGDTVFVGDLVYECVDGVACCNSPPGEDPTGNTWTPVPGRPEEIDVPEFTEVEALPWWVYAYEPDFWVVPEGEYFQVDGIGFECYVGFEADNGTDCVTALAASMDEYYGELDWAVFDSYGFTEARIDLYYDEFEYWDMGIDWFDMDEIVDELYSDADLFYIDWDGDVDDWFWLEGDVFYNWEEDKLYECLDPMSADLLSGGAADPNDSANFDSDEFLAVWSEITLDDDSMVLFEPYYYEFFEPMEAYDWAITTGDDFYGSFTFEYGSWCAHNDRIWDCWADDCQEVEPGTEEAEDSWYLTTYEADVYDEFEMLDMVVPVIECFPFPGDDYPYMAGDVVCDPIYPDFVAW